MLFLWLLLCVVVLLVLRQYWVNRKLYLMAKECPNDIKGYPFVGHAPYFLGDHKDLMNSVMMFGRESIKQGGLTSVWHGGYLSIHVADAEIAEIILKNHLHKSQNFTKITAAIMGNGILVAPVSIWRQRRKKLAPTFSVKNLNSFVEIFDQQSRIMLDLMRKQTNKSVSIWNFITSYTFDSICESTLGVKMGAQKVKDHDFLRKIGMILSMAANRYCKPWLANDTIYRMLSYHDELYGYTEDVNKYVTDIVQMTKFKVKNEKNNKVNGKTKDVRIKSLLEKLIEIKDSGKGFSDLELREELSVLIFAGTDTSAVGSSFAAVLLSRYPEVQDKVYLELKHVIGEKNHVEASDLSKLKYLEAVIKESMRLYPPVPMIGRRVIHHDIILPNGKRLLKDTNLKINIWAVHHNPKYWGPDVEEFRPERFLEEDTRHPCCFIPFSAGARNCIGFQYGMMSMKTNLANLLMNFELTVPEELQHIDPKSPISLKFEVMTRDVNDFKVCLVPRR